MTLAFLASYNSSSRVYCYYLNSVSSYQYWKITNLVNVFKYCFQRCQHLSSVLTRQVLYDKCPPRLIRLYDEFLLAPDAISAMHISYAGAISCGAKLARVLLVFMISQKQLQALHASRKYGCNVCDLHIWRKKCGSGARTAARAATR